MLFYRITKMKTSTILKTTVFPIFFATLVLSDCSSFYSPEPEAAIVEGQPACRMAVERLEDLNIPRVSHHTLMLNGELTVFGGHTDGFVPTATAEYYKDGNWHLLPMTYTHDGSFASVLNDGKVMLGGGSSESFGIGQSWGVEIYDPQGHSFKSLCIMDRKRTFPQSIALEDGSVLVSGNWYAEDAIERWTPEKGFSFLKASSEQRSSPFLLKSAPDNVIIFGGIDTKGNKLEGIVDRMNGEAYRDSILDRWTLFSNDKSMSGEGAIGEYSYLIPALNREDGRLGILKVNGESFSELELDHPLPSTGITGAPICYSSRFVVDRPSRVGWLSGSDSTGVVYAVKVNYDPSFEGGKSSISLYYADISELDVNPTMALPLSDGRLAFTGGYKVEGGNYLKNSNFSVSPVVLLMHTEAPVVSSSPNTVQIILSVLLLIAIGIILFRKKAEEAPVPASANTDMMARIISLMEDEKIFKKKGLTKTDVASALGTNVTYVSAAINTQHGCTFPELVADYRVRYAQDLMREHKNVRLSDIGEEAGFSNEQNFFRTFKARTGLTPQEWKKQHGL